MPRAGVVEVADAPDSKSGEGNLMGVQAPPPAPIKSTHHSTLYPSFLKLEIALVRPDLAHRFRLHPTPYKAWRFFMMAGFNPTDDSP